MCNVQCMMLTRGVKIHIISSLVVYSAFSTGWPKMNEWVLIRYNFLFKT